jgi:hypothetical protein
MTKVVYDDHGDRLFITRIIPLKDGRDMLLEVEYEGSLIGSYFHGTAVAQAITDASDEVPVALRIGDAR